MIESRVAVMVYEVTGEEARAMEKLFKGHRREYCERQEVCCDECSLVNYGLDCRNYPVGIEYGEPAKIVKLLESKGASIIEGFTCDGCIEQGGGAGRSYMVTMTNPEYNWPNEQKGS